MKSLLRMSDDELQLADTGEGLGAGTALGIAGVSSVLAFAGLMLRYSPGDDVPMAGMDSVGGQVLWAAGLGVAMIGAAIMIRSLFMKRLQYAVMFSLMIHFSLCVALKVVVVDVPMAMAAEIGDSDLPPRDITMPDYGGSENQSQQEQTWERPTDVDVPEAEQQQLERQEAELEVDSQIDPVEMQRRVAEAAVPERQQPEQERLEREQQLEIERQQREAEVQRPQEVEAPEVQTADADQPDLEAQEMNRSETELREMQRQMEARELQNDLQVNAANMKRAEVRPENDLRAEARQRQREAMEAQVADTNAESVDVAAASDAPEITTDAQQMAAQRQSDADLTAQARSGDGPQMSTPDLRVSSAAPSRSQSQNSDDATPSSGGAAALQRSSSASGRNTSAADATAESVSVAAVSGASAPNLTASNAASDVARGEASVPTGAASGGGAPAMTSNPFGVSTVQAGTVGRSQGPQSGPEMGNAVAANSASGNGQRSATRGSQSSDAVGTQAAEVTIGGAAPATDAAGSIGRVWTFNGGIRRLTQWNRPAIRIGISTKRIQPSFRLKWRWNDAGNKHNGTQRTHRPSHRT